MKWIITASMIITLSGCSITTKVHPVPESLSSLCIEKNDDIFMDDYLGILEKNLTELHVPTKTVSPAHAGECKDIMRYKANWQWDLAMYLKYANFSVFRGEDRIGFAEYNSAGGGLRPDKFGTTEGLIQPVLKELFKNQKATPPAQKSVPVSEAPAT